MADETWDDWISEVEDKLTLPPDGEYDFIVTKAEGKVSGSGNLMVQVDSKITSGPHSGKEIKRFYVIRSSEGSMAKKFMQSLGAVGITFDTLVKHKPTMQQIAKVMEGKPFRAKIKKKEDAQWGDYMEVQWAIKPPTGGAIEVTEFPSLTEGEALGYGSDSGAGVATDDDAGF